MSVMSKCAEKYALHN